MMDETNYNISQEISMQPEYFESTITNSKVQTNVLTLSTCAFVIGAGLIYPVNMKSNNFNHESTDHYYYDHSVSVHDSGTTINNNDLSINFMDNIKMEQSRRDRLVSVETNLEFIKDSITEIKKDLKELKNTTLKKRQIYWAAGIIITSVMASLGWICTHIYEVLEILKILSQKS